MNATGNTALRTKFAPMLPTYERIEKIPYDMMTIVTKTTNDLDKPSRDVSMKICWRKSTVQSQHSVQLFSNMSILERLQNQRIIERVVNRLKLFLSVKSIS